MSQSAAASTSKGASLGERAVTVVLSKLATTTVDSLTMIVIVWLLTRDQLAIISLLLAVFEVGRQLATFGRPDSLLYFYDAVAPEQRRDLIWRTWRRIFSVSLLLAGVFVALSFSTHLWLPNWDTDNRDMVAMGLRWFAVIAVFEYPSWMTTSLLIAARKERSAGLFETTTSVLIAVGLLLPMLLDLEIVWILRGMLAYTLARTLLSVRLLLRTYRESPPGEAVATETLREQSAYSLPLGVQLFTSKAARYIDRFVVGICLAEAFLADYNVAAQEIAFVKAFPIGVGVVLIPELVRRRLDGDYDEIRRLWCRGIEHVSRLVLPTAFFVLFFSGPMIEAFFGARFLGASLPMKVFAIALMFRVAQYGSVLQAFGNTRGILFASVINAGVNLTLSVPLTLGFGLVGTAIGTVLGAFSAVTVDLFLIRRHLGVRWREVMPWADLLHVASTAALSGAAVLAISSTVLQGRLSPTPLLAVLSVTYALVFTVLGLLLRSLRSSDARMFQLALKVLRGT